MSNFLITKRDPARLLFVKIAIEVDPTVVDAVVCSMQTSSPSIKRQYLRQLVKNPSDSNVNTEWTNSVREHICNAITLLVAANAQVALVNSVSDLGQWCADMHNIYAHEARLSSYLNKFKTSGVFGSLLNAVLKPIILADGTMVIPIIASKEIGASLKAMKTINPSNLGMLSISSQLYDDYDSNSLSVGSTTDVSHLQTLLTQNLETNSTVLNWNGEWNDDIIASGVLFGRLFKTLGVSEFARDGKFHDISTSEVLVLPRGVDGKAIASTNETTILSVGDYDIANWWAEAFKVNNRIPFDKRKEV